MILLNLGATCHCSEAGCNAQMPAQLALLANGGFAFRVDVSADKKERWQIFGEVGMPLPWHCFCPKHPHTPAQRPIIEPASIIPSTH